MKILLLALATSTAATTFMLPLANEKEITEAESQTYYFGLMQKGQKFRVKKDKAKTYLKGVWRLDRRAHVGGGHYVRADQGDDVSLICNDKRLIQVDFNHDKEKFSEFTGQLSELKQEANGQLSLAHRRFVPLDERHMAVAAYDYIVVLQRVSGVKEPGRAPE